MVIAMVFNVTFNNISVISWRSLEYPEETSDLSQVPDKLHHIILDVVHFAWAGFKLITLVVIGIDSISDYGVNRHFQQYFSYILTVSFICSGIQSKRRIPSTCRKSLTNFITLSCIEYTSPWEGFELVTLVVILGMVMMFNATFNNISAILWRSVFLVEETGIPGENHRHVAIRSFTNFIT
jgi:hypothetical protein